MRARAGRILAWFLLALAASLAAIPAARAQGGAVPAAAPFAPGSVCYASADTAETTAAILADPARWRCSGENFDWRKRSFLIRHDLTAAGAAGPSPHFVTFERQEFGELTVSLLFAGSNAITRAYRFGDTALGTSSMEAVLELPDALRRPQAVLFRTDDGGWPNIFLRARLSADPPVRIVAGRAHLWAALLCGLLIMPMLFDFGYFRALREPFPLFHALFCVLAVIQTASVCGLLALMAPMSHAHEMFVTYLSLDAMVAATYLFARYFLEPEAITPRERAALLVLIAVTLINGVATTVFIDAFGMWINHVYFGVFLSCLAAYFAILLMAARRGSRAARYLAVGLFPLAAVQFAQSASVFISESLSFDETWWQSMALLVEVMATAMAVGDRFMAVRGERDKARDEAALLSVLSERDDLTGLLNRRALVARYEDLLDDGFTVLALVDLDHFKEINDLYGHPAGDSVLRSAARALAGEDRRDLRAFRMGGEEFLLLLRGADAQGRAETLRRAIALAVARELPVIERPVTASMGLIDFSAAADRAARDFSTLYSRADWLLYEAKRQGRNRSCHETLRLFEPGASADALPAADAA